MLQSFKEGVVIPILQITRRSSPPSNLDNQTPQSQCQKELIMTKEVGKNNKSSIASVTSVSRSLSSEKPNKPIPKCWCSTLSTPGKLVYCAQNDRLNPGRAYYCCANTPACSFFAWRETNEEWKKMKETINTSSNGGVTTKTEATDLKPSITMITSSNVILQQQQLQQKTSTVTVVPHNNTPRNDKNVIQRTTLLLMSPPLFDVHPQFKRTMTTEEFVPENDEKEENVKDKKKPYQSSLPIAIPTRRKSHCGDSLDLARINWSNSTLREEGEVC